MPTTLFCPVCGAANRLVRTRCFACQWPLSPENTSRPSQRMKPRQRRSPFRRSQAQRSFALDRQGFSQSEPAGRFASPRITRRQMLIVGALVAVPLVAVPGVGAGIWWEMTPHPFYIYRGHSGGINGVAWSPDGKRIASASYDTTVQVWNALDGSHAFTYRGHASNVDGVAWSPDSRRIASASDDGSVQVWDAADGNNVFVYHGYVNDMDGPYPPLLTVAWSPDGKRIVSASTSPSSSGKSSDAVQVWDVDNGSHVFTYRGHGQYGVSDVAWSPDGTRIASAGMDGTVQVWDATNGANPYIYKGHTDPRNLNNDGSPVSYPTAPTAVSWSPDSTRIASAGSDGTVQVWDASDGGHVLIYRGHPLVASDLFGDDGGGPTNVAWSPDGTRIASTGDDDMQVWGATDGGNLCSYGNAGRPIAWSPDSKYILSAADNYTVLVWHAP